MSDVFSQKDVQKLLVACHRRCCICHRFCGVKMEIDHIIPKSEQGPSTFENGIPVCFECHAEIHSYNDQHPRGRKFQPEELRQHRDQWFDICKNRPDVFNARFLSAEVGPLQALIDELEFNQAVASQINPHGCLFSEEQFRRAISQGSIAILRDDLKKYLIDAYVAIGVANQRMRSANSHSPNAGDIYHTAAMKMAAMCATPIKEAHASLLKFLSPEG
jgi:hypothetical protein